VVDLREAYAGCERVARSHAENFPVASVLLPPRMRRHVAAVYAFARTADDFADEGDRPAPVRLDLLHGWCERLHEAAAGRPPAPPRAGEPAETPAIFAALAASIRDARLPVTLLEDLLSAFRQDVMTTRYRTWAEVDDYCRRSANPVGRLVLRIAGYDGPALGAQSDAICTALQLTNFWQDLGRDFARGRVYVPEEEWERCGASLDDLGRPALTPAWRLAVAGAVRRTRALFDAGRPLCDTIRGRLRYELRATWLGGVRILARLEPPHGDPLAARPSLGAADAPWLMWKMVAWR
jgi:squalene synthase HpnC